MSEENKDVKQEESQSTEDSSTEEKEQESTQETETVEEDVKTQETDLDETEDEESEEESEVSQDAIEKENYKRALQKEREKSKKLQEEKRALEMAKSESMTSTPEPQVSEPDSTDDINQQWERMKADVYLTRKMQEDPSFKDRLDLVRQEMENDHSLTAEAADMKVKSNIFDEMRKSFEEPQENKKIIKQIKSTATPEPNVKPTRANLKDAREGNIKFEDNKELQTALNTYKA
jgi:hypothetical protein